ncbi:LeuA family protein [Desulfogranum japonicum]|uniref:LeuA family protein n=1 Tax=Desulfogranum japonicum TaxID=231447 RepID=UPI0004266BAE|nr:hypothetical protein [Desulfogranum japonicum]
MYKIVDTTLREGEQTPGVQFSLEQKKQIVSYLAQIGVHEVELGIASPLFSCLPELITYTHALYPDLPCSLWSRCREEDIRCAATLGIRRVSLSIPVSDRHIVTKLGKNREWAEQHMLAGISLCMSLGLEVAVGFEDSSRAGTGFLQHMARQAERAGAWRIRLADTVGILSPGKAGDMVSLVAGSLQRAEVGVHTHNDFGMATGNAIAAYEHGALWADGAMLGLGERTGCARLEELVAYLSLVCEQPGFEVGVLKSFARYVAEAANEPVQARHPVLGDAIFACETGLHLQGLFKDPQTYEPFSPELVGAERRLMIGAKSGRSAIRFQMDRLGVDVGNDDAMDRCVAAVRDAARAKGGALSDAELIALCRVH